MADNNAPANSNAPTAPAAPATPEGGLPPSGVEGLFPHTIAPDVDNTAPDNQQAGPATDPNQINQLSEQFNQFREEAAKREERLTETIQTLMMRPAGAPAAAPQQQQQPTGLNLSDLPDPVENPKTYNEALQARIAEYVASSTESQSQALVSQMSSAQTLNNLWSKVQTQHPELAQRQILLQGAAAAEFSALRAQGIDPLQAAAQNPDGIVSGIVNRMNAELGVAPGAPGPTAPGTPPSASRAAGVAGGSQPTVPTQPTEPKTSTFTQQLKDSQQRDGLI